MGDSTCRIDAVVALHNSRSSFPAACRRAATAVNGSTSTSASQDRDDRRETKDTLPATLRNRRRAPARGRRKNPGTRGAMRTGAAVSVVGGGLADRLGLVKLRNAGHGAGIVAIALPMAALHRLAQAAIEIGMRLAQVRDDLEIGTPYLRQVDLLDVDETQELAHRLRHLAAAFIARAAALRHADLRSELLLVEAEAEADFARIEDAVEQFHGSSMRVSRDRRPCLSHWHIFALSSPHRKRR
jgi:hypothetical protein